MYKVIIIGGGFAGLAAAAKLLALKNIFQVTLLDKKEVSDFLPSLPDTIGRKISPRFLSYNINNFAINKGFSFVSEEVIAVNLDEKIVTTAKQNLQYDYLVIASGSETNFYGNDDIRKRSFKLDSANDASRILKELDIKVFKNYIVSGGGYTGIEVATNLRSFLDKNKRQGRIIIIERASTILGPLPEWIRRYVLNNLAKMDIEVFLNTTIERIEDSSIYISVGKTFDNYFLVWAAGVKTPGFVQNLKITKNAQGRVEVDEHLKLNENCFVAGDAAYFKYKNIYLRMAVQFAIAQGEIAANNIIRSAKGKKLIKYKPVDLGYIIPMANNRSCGTVFGLNVKGSIATMFHFIMCLYRLYGVKNKVGFVRSLLHM